MRSWLPPLMIGAVLVVAPGWVTFAVAFAVVALALVVRLLILREWLKGKR